MDGVTFNNRLCAITDVLPIEFKEYVLSVSWDRGHSAGYEEILNIAEGMTYDLKKVLTAYNERMEVEG